jgi:hypothetical protein
VVTLNDTGNTNFQGAKGVAINTRYQKAPTAPDAYNGQGVGFHQYHSAIPLVKEWNLDVQQQIATSMEFELAYVGSNLPFVVDINQVPEGLLSPTDSPGSLPILNIRASPALLHRPFPTTTPWRRPSHGA